MSDFEHKIKLFCKKYLANSVAHQHMQSLCNGVTHWPQTASIEELV